MRLALIEAQAERTRGNEIIIHIEWRKDSNQTTESVKEKEMEKRETIQIIIGICSTNSK